MPDVPSQVFTPALKKRADVVPITIPALVGHLARRPNGEIVVVESLTLNRVANVRAGQDITEPRLTALVRPITQRKSGTVDGATLKRCDRMTAARDLATA